LDQKSAAIEAISSGSEVRGEERERRRACILFLVEGRVSLIFLIRFGLLTEEAPGLRALASMPPDLRRSSTLALSPELLKEARSGLRLKKSSEEDEGS
jgi:hypothetical protein